VVPPEVSYGEKLPPFTIKAEAWPDRANVDIKAHMSEGHLVATGAFKPAPKQTLEMDARFDVRDVPLSEMVPLLVKSGIVPPEFKPKSLWFDCSARIAGPFQQILDHAPLNLENCRVKGDGAQIDVARATRHPSGIWDPFSITLTRVRISKILETLNAKPGDAVMTDFGRLSGMIELKSPDEAHFKGNLEGARIAFRRHNVRAEQTIQSMKASVDLEGDRFKGLLNDVVVENGEFVGRAELEFNRKVKDGSIHIDIQSLILDPAVQKTLVNGLLGSAKGNGDLRVQDGRLTEMKSELTINKTEGSELRFDKAEFKAKLAEAGSVMIDVESPVLEFSRTSPMATAMAPLFFEHQFQNDWISLHDVEFQAHAPPGGGIRWSHGRAKLENGQIGLSSEGAMSQERRLIGWVEMDYPSVKKLRFALSGTTNAPELSDNSPSLIDLRKRMRVDDLVLGLKIQ
ncbi:MAG TPA: hypothetical protein VM432_10840, partial [Bdellovibrionales bacterium]|nr:hypothetical protein [Bdellovibrionales bacterium]